MSGPSFAMLCCAHGAESIVKQTIAGHGWRLAFSRPGFVTAKHDGEPPLPGGIFIRTAAHSLGQVRGEASTPMVEEIRRSLDAARESGRIAKPLDQLHVWPKDRQPIGRFGFEPGPDEVSRAVAEQLHRQLAGEMLTSDCPNRIAQPGEHVLDVVLIEPGHWFFGAHIAGDWPSRWPGGVQPIDPPEPPISRAYYKAAEAIVWSGFEMKPNDVAVEIGSAPGGACQRLLELGLRVIGVDPAEMDPRIADHPRFEHWRARGGDLPRREFRHARWLLVDSNVRPEKTLVTVGNLVTNRHTHFAGLLLTMKIGDYDRPGAAAGERTGTLARIDQWTERIRSWGATRIDVRQLARNKREVCFAVTLPSDAPAR